MFILFLSQVLFIMTQKIGVFVNMIPQLYLLKNNFQLYLIKC